MKKWIILGLTVAMAAVVACQSDFSNRSMLDSIAMDSAYIEYRTINHINAAHIVQGAYDLDSIGMVLKSHTHLTTICDIPDLELTDIRGGLLYRNTHCDLEKAGLVLYHKYPGFFQMQDADRDYLRGKYDEMYGPVEKEELIRLFKIRRNED